MKKTIAAFLVSIIVFSLFPVVSLAAPFSQGDGTESNPYGISTPEELNAVRDYPNAHFVLLNDIDMSAATSEGGAYWNDGAGWEPINVLDGTFDGDGYTIVGLMVHRPEADNIGLFDQVSSGGIVKRLGIVESNIYGGDDRAGSICARNYGTIELCYHTGTVIGSDIGDTGGIAGAIFNNGKIQKCYNAGSIDIYQTTFSGASSFGGIAGCAYTSGIAVSDCYNIGIVRGMGSVGGVAGSGSFAIRNCYSIHGYGSALIDDPSGIYLDDNGLYYFETCKYQKGAYNTLNNTEYGIALTNDQMQMASSFVEFDFDTIWTMDGNSSYPYPELRGVNQTNLPENIVDFAGGNGFPYSPFLVSTPEELDNVRNYTWGCFELTNDIDMGQATNEGGAYYNNGHGFIPIIGFSGVFNGNGFDITGLEINQGTEPAGLFITQYALITNLGITDVDILGDDAGGIVSSGYGTEISYCHVSGNVKPCSRYGAAGGIAGTLNHGGISNCSNDADIGSSGGTQGGILGESWYSTISMCFNTGTIAPGDSRTHAGGICGYNANSGQIIDCYNAGNTGQSQYFNHGVGGITGENNATILRCYNVGYVKSPIAIATVQNGIQECYYLDNGGASITGATAKTDEQLYYQETYAGFDFSRIWTMAGDADYPYAELQDMPYTGITYQGEVNFEGGNGTETNPYQITSPAQLNEIRYYPNKHFILLNDIDLSAETSEGGEYYNDGLGWEPIGSSAFPFMGVFNGSGKKINGLSINRPYKTDTHDVYTGLFGVIDWGAQIKNIQLIGANIVGARVSGGIVGYVPSSSLVKNCSFEGSVTSTKNDDTSTVYSGGIAGYCSGAISCCYNSGLIKSTGYSGGVCGGTYGNVSNCYNTGFIIGTLGSGGIVGESSNSHIFNCYNIGNIYSGTGLIGLSHWEDNVLENCYYTEEDISGADSSDTVQNVAGKSAKAMQQQSTFTGFDFDTVWTMEGNDSYPFPELRDMTQVDIPENNTDFSGGNGLIYNPYRIVTPQNLHHVRDNLSAWYILDCDIDLSEVTGPNGEHHNDGLGWQPIGNKNTPFNGFLDGKGYSVTGLFINRIQSDHIGLFGYTGKSARIKNLNVDGNIKAKNFVGAMTGYNQGEITSCKSSGDISGVWYVGGITGLNNRIVTQCSNAANITGMVYIGGVCGRNGTGTSTGHGVISDSSNTGNISGEVDIGGITGDNAYSNITACFNTGFITASNNSAGGITGLNFYGSINKCYNTGKITMGPGDGNIGGIAGSSSAGNIENCFNTGMFSSFDAGTILGRNIYDTVISCCYSISPNAYSSFTKNEINCVVKDYYFFYEGTADPGTQGKNRIEMCSQTTFTNYDFENIWEIAEDRFPILQGVPYVYTNTIDISLESTNMHTGVSSKLTAQISPNNATNKNIGWYTSDANVAIVSDGVVTGVGPGTAVITAQAQDGGFTGVCNVTVIQPVTGVSLDKHTLKLGPGNESSLTATIIPENATNQYVTWSSSDEAVATVDQSGKVTGKSKGVITITVTTEDGGFIDTCTVTVIQPVTNVSLNSSDTETMIVGTSKTLSATVSPSNATNKQLAWSSNNSAVAKVDQNGRVTAVAPGTATITATADGVSDTCKITVQKKAVTSVSLSSQSSTMEIGNSLSLKATVSPSDATNKKMSWSSSNPAVASVDQNGKVTALSAGRTTITATADGVSDTCQITVSAASVSYQSHVQNIGWQDWKKDGNSSGTSGQSLRLEAMRIKLDGIDGGIEYRTHVQNIGWMDWASNGVLSGTSGQSLRLEAIKIRLTGAAAEKYDIYYRVHAQNFGWMGWAKNGEAAGTAGFSYRLEAIQIKLVAKGGAAPGSSTDAFVDNNAKPSTASVIYQSHVQNIGWQDWMSNGDSSGTSGQSLRLEGMCIKLDNIDGGIEYQTHVQNIGWMDWVFNGALSGTSGRSLRLEAIKIRLTGAAAEKYDVYYRVHAQNFGWMGWARNGESAGTAGFSYRLEAIQIVLVSKGGAAPGSTANAFIQNGI